MNLGFKTPDYSAGITSPSGDEPPMKTAHPEFHIPDAPAAMMSMPEKGHAHVKYHIKEKSTRMEGKKKKHSLTIAIHSMQPAAAPTQAPDDGDAMQEQAPDFGDGPDTPPAQ